MFYPLRASQVYEADITTTIVVRGWVHPPADSTIPGLRCHYVFGQISDLALNRMFEGSADKSLPPRQFAEYDEPLTQVELDPSPRQWGNDLILQPGAPAVLTLAQTVEGLGRWGVWLVVVAVVMLPLPMALFARDERRWYDWLCAAGVGAALAFTLAAAAFVFNRWLSLRSIRGLPVLDQRAAATGSRRFFGIPLVLVWVFGCVWLYTARPLVGEDIVFNGLLSLVIAFLAGVSFFSLRATGRNGLLFLCFTMVHMALFAVTGLGLHRWLLGYE